MGKYLNVIIAIVILVIVTAVCSNFFYRKGQENSWAMAQQLVPLSEGEIYLCVEKTDTNGVSFLTVQEISKAAKNTTTNTEAGNKVFSLKTKQQIRQQIKGQPHRAVLF